MSGKPVDQEAVKEAREKVKQMVSETESYFLKGKKFIAGDEISIADLLGVCELVQLYGCHEQGLYESSPVVKAWVNRVREACNPAFEESMAKINEIHKTFLSDKK